MIIVMNASAACERWALPIVGVLCCCIFVRFEPVNVALELEWCTCAIPGAVPPQIRGTHTRQLCAGLSIQLWWSNISWCDPMSEGQMRAKSILPVYLVYHVRTFGYMRIQCSWIVLTSCQRNYSSFSKNCVANSSCVKSQTWPAAQCVGGRASWRRIGKTVSQWKWIRNETGLEHGGEGRIHAA